MELCTTQLQAHHYIGLVCSDELAAESYIVIHERALT